MGRKRKSRQERGLGSGEHKKMSKNHPGQSDVIANRREMVAHMKLRKMTEREIQKWLTEHGHLNPDSGQPWSLGTIHDDCAANREVWRAQALVSETDRCEELLAEIEEVKAAAWAKGDEETVLKAIKAERELRGLDAPTRSKVGGLEGAPPVKLEHVPPSDPAAFAASVNAILERLDAQRRKHGQPDSVPAE